jgi:hypothetical protein
MDLSSQISFALCAKLERGGRERRETREGERGDET